MEIFMTASSNETLNNKVWQLKALNEELGKLTVTIEDTLTVGRDKDNNVVLGSKQVSRNHAELRVINGALQVSDLGSSNGTFVNDTKIEPNLAHSLKLDDVVSFAIYKFQVSQGVQQKAQDATPVESNSNTPVEPDKTVELAASATTDGIPKNSETANLEAAKEQGVEDSIKPQASIETSAQTNDYPIDHPIKTEEVDTSNKATLNEQLEKELEEPIAYGDPDQDSSELNKPAVQEEAVDTLSDAPDIESTNNNEHFNELAKESDPDVLRAKQAATTKLSGTVDIDPTPSEKEASSLNTVDEQQQHDVAHVNRSNTSANQAPERKVSSLWWIILILLGLAAALWLFNSGQMG